MTRKVLGLLLIFFLVFGSGCKVIYKNRVPVTKSKKRYAWYNASHKKKKRTKTVWMKVHKGKFKDQPKEQAPATISEGPVNDQ